MAKKKKTSKNEKSPTLGFSVELTGLVLILIGIIGFGFGPVGALLKKFAMFLLGEWWPVVLLLVLTLGFLMLFKRKMPNFMSQRAIGLYLIIIVILIMSHFIKMAESPSKIFATTMHNYMDRIASIGMNNAISSSGQTSITIGGGIFGAVFSFGCASLFGLNGTYIVLVFLLIFGIVLLFNVNLSEILSRFIATFKWAKDSISEEDDSEERSKALEKRLLEQEPEIKEDKKSYLVESVEEIKAEPLEEMENREEPRLIMPDLPNANPNAPTVNLNYKLPPMSILDDPERSKKTNSNQFLINNKQNLERVLNDFHIVGKVVDVHMGPSVTQFELTVPSGTKVSRISSINKEIALALAAKDVRIEAPIPGKNTIGIEIPNQSIAPVKIKEILSSKQILNNKSGIWVALGKDIMGTPIGADLTKMPHLLVAGSTGSGKSVCINSIINSILMRYRPDEVKLLLVDPKKVELSNYNGVPHLMCPVVNDPKKASLALQKIVVEMDRRYNVFADAGVKKIDDYNEMIDKSNDENPSLHQPRMPYIIAIIDELADLMLVASKEVEESIMRITQLARAAGIHLIVATQRPSTDVITGVVKSNIPSRISFAVASNIDSRTILDSPGAEKLLGKGDMLYLPMGENHPIRIQGCFISDDEIRRVIDAVCKEQVAQYDEALTKLNEMPISEINSNDDYDEPMYDEIVEFAMQTGKISASLIQRRFRFGYNRAARVLDLLEKRGIVGPANGAKPRDVIANKEEENN